MGVSVIDDSTGIVDHEDGEILYPFDPSKIKIESKVATIDSLLKRLRFNEINLSPDFQRGDLIWQQKEQSRLIESLLVRIPIPAFYIDASDDENWVIIDGLQRLTALKKYVINQDFKLTELEYLSQLKDLYFDELPRKFQRRIEETQVTLMLVEKGTPSNVIFNLFKRINTGGSTLTAQEIRHALNIGKVTILLKNIISSVAFGNVWKTNNLRMEKQEIALRVIGYYVMDLHEIVQHNYDDYLNAAMQKINDSSEVFLKNIETKFNSGLNLATQIFGKYAFRKQFDDDGRMNPLNKPLFETWIYNLSLLSDIEKKVLVKNSGDLNKEFVKIMINDGKFIQSISSSKPNAIFYRNDVVKNLIGKYSI